MEQWVWAALLGALVIIVAIAAIARLRRTRRRRQVLHGYENTIAHLDTSYHVLREGDAALRDGAYQRALDLATRALDRPGPGSYRVAAGHAIAGAAAAGLGRHRSAAEHLSTAFLLDVSGDMVPSRSALLRELAASKLALCEIEEAIDLTHEAARRARNDEERAAAVLVESQAQLLRGDTARAGQAVQAAAQNSRLLEQRAQAEQLLGRIAAAEGRFAPADQHLARAADLSAASHDNVRLAAVFADQADVAEQRGDVTAALGKWRKALELLARHASEHAALAAAFARTAAAIAETGDSADVDRYLSAAEAEFAQCELPDAAMLLAWTRARIAEARGDQGAAVSSLGEALLNAEQLGLVYWRDRIGVEVP